MKYIQYIQYINISICKLTMGNSSNKNNLRLKYCNKKLSEQDVLNTAFFKIDELRELYKEYIITEQCLIILSIGLSIIAENKGFKMNFYIDSNDKNTYVSINDSKTNKYYITYNHNKYRFTVNSAKTYTFTDASQIEMYFDLQKQLHKYE